MAETLQTIEMFAGLGPDGQPIVEQLPVRELDSDKLQLTRSPAFVKGVASGDTIRCAPETRDIILVQRSGNLSIRVFSRGQIALLADRLTPALEHLGGELDLQNERMLVYSIHVSCGFDAIEAILEREVDAAEDSGWLYGNVYDPTDGETPLNWWQEILKPE